MEDERNLQKIIEQVVEIVRCPALFCVVNAAVLFSVRSVLFDFIRDVRRMRENVDNERRADAPVCGQQT